MYTAIGTYPDGREAALEFDTLDAAMRKIRDWAEADEMEAEENRKGGVCGILGEVMFIRYTLVTPASLSAAPPNTHPTHIKPQQHPPANGKPFQLRLAE
jgi:hypothetical protein